MIQVGGSQGILSIWKADELKSLTQLQLHKTKVTALIQVKNHVWAGSEENLIYVIDTAVKFYLMRSIMLRR